MSSDNDDEGIVQVVTMDTLTNTYHSIYTGEKPKIDDSIDPLKKTLGVPDSPVRRRTPRGAFRTKSIPMVNTSSPPTHRTLTRTKTFSDSSDGGNTGGGIGGGLKSSSIITIMSTFNQSQGSKLDLGRSSAGLHSKVEQQAVCNECFEEYHAFMGWVIFFTILVIVVSFNAVFLGLILADSPGQQSIWYRLQNIDSFRQTLANAEQILSSTLPEARTLTQNETVGSIETLADLQNKGLDLEKQFSILFQDADQYWNYCLITGITQIIFAAFAISILIIHRKDPVFSSRSTAFIVQIAISAPMVIISCLIYSATALLQISDDYSSKLYLYLGLSISTLAIFFMEMFLSALTCRMYVIFTAFYQVVVKNPVALYFRKSIYHLVLFIVSVLPVILAYFGYLVYSHANYALVLVLFVVGIYYPAAITYYTWKIKGESQKYSDYYSNMRTVIFFSITFLSVILASIFFPSSIYGALGFQYIGQCCITVYLADLICSLQYIRWRNKEAVEIISLNGSKSVV